VNPENEITVIDEELRESIKNYLRSDGPGGKRIIASFLEEFEKLADRSPKDDPTNLKNHMGFIVSHMKQTWDESLQITDSGNIEIGVCTDETLGFKEDRTKLLHNPSPVAWAVYLIRGIGGRYAFVNPTMYFEKKGEPMPAVYHNGFLISEKAWKREGWNRIGNFSSYEHPASGASPIPFFRNVMERIDLESIVGEAIESYKVERGI
jgi:hypothetical protein